MELRCIAQRRGKLSSFLKRELQMSTGLINRLKWGDALRVNGCCQHTDYPVQPGDTITVTLDEETPEYPAQPGGLNILYEDEWLLAVDKPAGMMVHPSAARNTGTLANRVLGYYQQTGQPCRFHPVTRLDRDTIGVVLLAKNGHTHARMMAALQAGMVHKTYQAWVWGGPDEDCGEVDAPIHRPDPLRMMRCVDPAGKPARTLWRVLRRETGCTLLELQPCTGRTHQLRVHCLYMGWPILGDPQYFTSASAAQNAELGLCTQQLCAAKLCFAHPLTGAPMELRSGLAFQV